MAAQSRTPWARFALVSKDRPVESDHVYFSRPLHKIGRSAERCDVVLDLQYISSVHCVVELEGRTEDGLPIVRLEDKSRNGVWVNGDRVGKGNSAHLESGFTVHFTRPGLKATGVEPRIYKFEVLQLEVEAKPEAVNITQDLNSSALGSPQSARPLVGGSPAKKKRRRSIENDETVAEDPRDAQVKDLTSQLKEAKSHLAAVTDSMTEINAKHELALEKAQTKRQELAAQVKKLVTERQQLTTSVEELVAKLDAAAVSHKKQLKSLQQQLTERDSELDALKKECDEAKRALEETDASLNERNKQFVVLKAENSDLMKRLATSEKQAEGAQSTAVGESDKQRAVHERQRQIEKTIAALRQELDASRLRVSELEDKAGQTSVPAPAPEQTTAASARSNEVIARLQQQLAAARSFFKQIQALGVEGESALGPIDAAIDDGVVAASSALGLLRGDGSKPAAEPAERTLNADSEPVVEGSAVADDTKSDNEPGDANAVDDEMEMEPNDDAHEEEPVETEQELPEPEATKAHESDRELPDDATEAEDGHRSDPGSDKSSGSRSTTIGSADVDMD